MGLDGATGYDSVSGASAPSASLTDFTLYVSFVPSSAWWSAYVAAGETPGRIRVTNSDGTVEYARDVLVAPTSSLVVLRVLWPGAQSGTPSLRVYPNATGAYAVTDTYGGRAAYVDWLGLWTLDEDPTASAPQFSNRVANANHGTAMGTIDAGASVASKLGRGIDADGTSDYINCGSFDSQLGSATAATLMAWCKRETSGSNPGRCIFGLGDSINNRIVVDVWDDGKVYFTVESGAASYPNASASGTDWMHVAMVYNGTLSGLSRIAAYINGASATLTSGGVGPSSQIASDPSDFLIHRDNGSRYSGGIIDDVQLQSPIRSAAWIAYEYTITNAPASFWSASGWTALSATSNRRRRLILCGGSR